MAEGWFNYATSDPRVLGIVSWVGLFVTIAGFWLAIAQIRKVATASKASADAVTTIVKAVRSQEQAAKIATAMDHLGSAQAMMKDDNLDAVAAHLKVGWNALMSARELTENTMDRDDLDSYVTSTRRLLDDISAPNAAMPTPARTSTRRHGEISKITSGLGAMHARLNALLAGIGISS